jgi:lysozyme
MQAKTASNVKIIDVSHHQGSINWASVKADGVQGTFIKATEGKSMVDLKFSSNALGAATAGLKVGFYHYAHPELNDPFSEAANFFRTVSGHKADFPHVLDVEGEADNIAGGGAALTAWCVTWLKEVERLTGHPAMIYTGASFAKDNLGKELAKWPLWIAHYGTETPMANSTWDKWSVFQYTSRGSVKGITGNVDVNAMEKAFYDKYTGDPPNANIDKDALRETATPTGRNPFKTAEDTIKIVVDDKLAAYGRVIDGHVYLPLRQLGEALGANVHWDAITATPYVDGKVITNFKLIDGKTYIGVRSAAELLGGTVSWDGTTKKVYFYN